MLTVAMAASGHERAEKTAAKGETHKHSRGSTRQLGPSGAQLPKAFGLHERHLASSFSDEPDQSEDKVARNRNCERRSNRLHHASHPDLPSANNGTIEFYITDIKCREIGCFNIDETCFFQKPD
jgi:hypothetical protein